MFSCCLNNLFGNCVKLIDLQNALDLCAETLNEPKISSGNADNRSRSFRVGKIIYLQRDA